MWTDHLKYAVVQGAVRRKICIYTVFRIIIFFVLFKMESELALLREENARLMAEITGLEFEKAELIERVAKLEEKQLENVVIKNLLHASCVSASGQVSRKT